MFFTRTIYRKLLVPLGLVLVMVITLGVSGVLGLHSYRDVVVEFDRILNHTPHKSHLAAGVALMLEPLRVPISVRSPKFGALAKAQQKEFLETHDEARRRIQQFRHRLEDMPPTELPPPQRAVITVLVDSMDRELDSLQVLQGSLTNPDEHAATVDAMLRTVADAEILAQRVPDPGEAIDKTLQAAKRDARTKQIIVYVVSAVACVFLIGLVRFVYVALFDPIRKLHQGALRVAHGDFDFRVKLPAKDEMAELAEAFNEMTRRFQDIAGDLDRQVRERSQQLVRSERLANVGVLSAGVAHEINNPLHAIAMAAESIADRVSPVLGKLDAGEAQVIRQYLTMIQHESERCRQITERLLDFSRNREAVREATDLTQVVQETITMLQALSRYRGKQIVLEPHGSCIAEVCASEIKQVVLNLMANGLEAMDRGGTLRIRISEQTDHVRLTFEDEGCGMTSETIERIFEPFYTQKSNGQGTGLGLSICHRIINQHGGSIDVSSAGPGQGSTFCVRLPRRAAQRAA